MAKKTNAAAKQQAAELLSSTNNDEEIRAVTAELFAELKGKVRKYSDLYLYLGILLFTFCVSILILQHFFVLANDCML